MEIKITVNVEGVEPIEAKVDIPEKKDETGSLSPYARFFDEDCWSNWRPDWELNLLFLVTMQNYFNDRFRCDGVVYLNDVYEALGFERVPEYENLVGWRLGHPEGDDYIDFGIHRENANNWYNKRPLLDFNCIGNIWEL